jgi:hypothetical protein
MSERARHVLQLIDQAERIRQRNPTLFAAQLHANGRDRDVRQLAAAAERKRCEKLSPHVRKDQIDAERIDNREWEEKHARKREEKFATFARESAGMRREQRRRLAQKPEGCLELCRSAIQELTSISTVAAGNIAPSRGGGEPIGPGQQQTLDDDPRWLENWTVIGTRLCQVLELIDEAKGLGTVAATNQLLGEEKDQLIVHVSNQGLRAQAVVDKLGTHIAGSVETVRRVRRREGYDHLGCPREEGPRA